LGHKYTVPLGRLGRRWRGVILQWIFKKWDWEASTGFIWLRKGGRWRALVNAEMNFRFRENAGNFLTRR